MHGLAALIAVSCAAVACAAPQTAPRRETAVITSGVLRGAELELAYVEWHGRGTPLVLLHGLGGNALSWAGLAGSLAGRHVIALDLPGHGESPAIDEWAIQPLAARLAVAVQARWPGPLLWGGHSWGGKLAVLAASAHEAARGILLVDPVPLSAMTIPDFGAVADFLFGGELTSWSTIEEAIDAVRLLPAYRTWTPDTERAFRRGIRVQDTGDVATILTRQRAIDILEATYAADITGHARDLRVPVLLVMAEESRGFQALNISTLPAATHVFVPGNHWLPTNSVAAMATPIELWLSRTDPVEEGSLQP